MRFRLGMAALVVAAITSGCASDKEQINPAKLERFQPSQRFDVRWHQSVGKMGLNVLQPVVTSNAVAVANYAGEMFSFDRTTGKRIWRVKTGFSVTGALGVGDGMLFVGGEKGDVAAFDETNGQRVWAVKLSSEVLSAPRLSDGIVVVRTGDGRIAGLDVKTGQRLWLYERATPALVARNNAGVTIRNGIVYAGFPAGKLVAINLRNGVIVWEAAVSQPRGNTELERVSDITSLPILDDSQICAVSFQGRLVCFDAERGASLWSRDISSDKGLTISRKYLFTTDTVGTVMALDKLTGRTYWKNDQLGFRATTLPLALDNCLVVADYEGFLHALDRDDGHFVARLKVSDTLEDPYDSAAFQNVDRSGIPAAPIAMSDGMLVLTRDGSLFFITIH